MRRHIFSKKRIDKERDSTRTERFLKAGETALAIGAGAVFFQSSKAGRMFNEVSEAVIPIAKDIKKDLHQSGKNARKFTTLKNTYNKRIGKNGIEVRKRILKNKSKYKNNKNKLKLKDTKGLGKNLRRVKEVTRSAQTKKNIKKNKIDAELRKRAFNKLKKDPRFANVSEDRIDQLVKTVYKKIEDTDIQKINDDSILLTIAKKTFEGNKIAIEEQKDFIREVAKQKAKRSDEYKLIGEKYIKAFSENVRDKALEYESLEHVNSGTVYKRIDKFARKLGLNIDSEMLINGSKALTLGDLEEIQSNGNRLLDNIEFDTRVVKSLEKNSNNKTIEKDIQYDLKKDLEELLDKSKKDSRYKSLVVDESLRYRVNANGEKEFFDQGETIDFLNTIKEKFKNTLPGNILLKGSTAEQPLITVIGQGERSGTAHLQKITRGISDKDFNGETVDMMLHIGGKTYDFIESANDVLLSNDYIEQELVVGAKAKELRMLIGTRDRFIPGASNSEVARFLDINQNGLSRAKGFFSKLKDPDWGMNVAESARSWLIDSKATSADLENMLNYTDSYTLQNTYNKITYAIGGIDNKIQGVSDSMLKELSETIDNLNVVSNKKIEMINSLLNGDTNEVLNMIDKNKDIIKNNELLRLVELSKVDSEALENFSRTRHIERASLIKNIMGMYDTSEDVSLNLEGHMRIELIKDIFQSIDDETDLTKNNISNLISNLSNLTDAERKSFKNIELVSLFEKDVIPSSVNDFSEGLDQVFGRNRLGRFMDRIQSNDEFKNELNTSLEILKSNIGLSSNRYMTKLNEMDYKDFSDSMFVNTKNNTRSFIGNMANDIIEAINNDIKIDAQEMYESTRDYFKSFVAGRYNQEDINSNTLGLSYMVNRLGYAVDALGLGLSDQSTSSPIDSIKNIALKRILPVMAIYEAGSVLNYESEKITGISLKGAAANSVRNLDMGARKILDKTHLSGLMNNIAESSVIHEYWFGQRHFNNEEEEQDWYDNGYSAVRGGRGWIFGSASEFRGSNINYWQPNYLKRAHSNYHDVSIYGSVDEKWAHSWIPTIQHPLSPLRALLDPYWLENKHLKENDRPYPVSAKMFSEGTPWGAILNPTIGQALKPVKIMPRAKRRLGKDGRDAEAIIESLNTRIKQKGNENDDLLIIRGTDIRNGVYTPYGNPNKSELNISTEYGKPTVKGMDYMDSVEDLSEYDVPKGLYYQDVEFGKYANKIQEADQDIQRQYRYVQDNQLDNVEKQAVNAIHGINNYIKSRGKVSSPSSEFRVSNSPNKQNDGVYVYNNLVNQKLRADENYYLQQEYKYMVDKSPWNDLKRDAMYSAKNISGIYGFLGDKLFGENAYTYRLENAGQMSSFTRGFWDSAIGGIGGETMEIARRFFPNQDRSRINVNPLRNNMPDWIPDSYHFGDPYTNIPKGEMRLPGKGYETLNALHPDSFGDYGAFDRYKILADIAPNSVEYKTWKKIAENTITDQNLKKQMEDIEARTAKMSGKHEFFEYTYIKNNTQYEDAVIKSINSDGTLTLANNQQIKMAGIKTNEDTREVLMEMLNPGDKVHLRTTKSFNYDKDTNESTKMAVIYKDSENINESLMNRGGATEDKSDNSALAKLGRSSAGQEVNGALLELVAHAPIPLVHNKFLKVETAFESYKNESIYGHTFQTWDHPIMNFIEPAFNRQSDKSLLQEFLAVKYAMFHFGKVADKIEHGKLHFGSSIVLSTLNPTAFVGGNVTMFLSGMSNKNVWSNRSNFATAWQTGAEIGTALGTAKYVLDNADNPIKSTLGGAITGIQAAEIIQKLGGAFEDIDHKHAALIGAGIGLGLSAIKNPGFDKDKMFKPHVSNYVKKKWELDEYFDRLEYVKYEGLYRVASARAALFEKTPVRAIFNDIDKNKKKIAKLNRKEKKLQEQQHGDLAKNQYEIEEIRRKKMALQEDVNMFFKGGKYTQAAVAYKKKAESTVYGLDETATKDEILAAVPDQYKDHFQAFMDITDKKEQKEILKYVPDYLQRPLQIAWGEKPNKVQSNKKYFRAHALPGATWRGWKPNINLKHVKMKTIQNEGMVLSDFGYYDSEKSKPTYEMAPDINYYNQGEGLISQKVKLTSAMHGLGLNASNVSVSSTSRPGTWIVSDIVGNASDVTKAASYQAMNAVSNVLGSLF